MKVPLRRVPALLFALSCVMAGHAHAQVSTPLVHWQLEVIQNGETVDTFKADTPLEQTQTETREHEATHVVGCAQMPAAHIVLTRSIAVTPSTSDERGVSFMIDATEMLEDAAAQRTGEGCTLPPQPRVVHATHPALMVSASGWTDWPVVAHDPVLTYRLQATVDPSATPKSQGTVPASGPAASAGNAAVAAGTISGAASAAHPAATPTITPTITPATAPSATPATDAPGAGVPDVTVPDDNTSH
ncbi:hypothetical protein [Pararobbsia alpina]|uniref:Uncharacterized protein n=1 Tax=Pararobbsia alpina TaxID=621374 RepID=A0A6S7AVZ4_9BURK|nr:hypothetical protein [Pararobbsia alpina]CAB3778914.1 hypothetical protein LMG28138_00694 [Pararobbsia alpina]